MTRTTRFFLAAIGVLAFVAGYSRPASMQQTPPVRTIAGAGETSSVDFVVLGRDGQPLLDLRPDEISIRIGGKSHAIKTLKLVKFSSEASAVASDREPPPPPFGTNAAGDAGRSVVFVIEDESILPGNEPPMRTAIAQFLATLAPRDQVALVTVPHGSIRLNFTSDHDAVRKAVSEVGGQAKRNETVSDAACRTRFTLQKMVETIETLGRGVGPTTFVLFSSSMMTDRSAVQISAGRNTSTGGANVGMCDVATEEFSRVNVAATAARANLFIIQPDPVMAAQTPVADPNSPNNRGSDNPRAGLESLAGVTGGMVMNLSDASLPRIARETSAYYLATFDTEPGERDGNSHQLSIKVTREGASVRSRPDAFIAKADPSAARQAAANPTTLMMDSRVFTDLPLRVTGYTARNTQAGELKIVALGEIVDPTVVSAAAAAGLFDQSGRLIAQWTAQPSDTGRPIVMAALVAPPGTYRLRMAITDKDGRRGTADTEVTSELIPAGPLKLSAMVLGLSRNNGQFLPKLEFKNEAVVLANFEVYGAIGGSKLQVILEISQTLNGPAFLAMPAVASRTGEDDRFAVTAAIPLQALPPDDYVIRAIVSAEGQAEGRIVRTLRKTQ